MIRFIGQTEDGKWVVGNTLIQNGTMAILGSNFEWVDGSEFNDGGNEWWFVLPSTVRVLS